MRKTCLYYLFLLKWNIHTRSLVVSVCWTRSATKICQKLKAKWMCQWIFCKHLVSSFFFVFCFVLSILLLFSNPTEEVDKVQMRLVCYMLFHCVWAKDNHLLQHRIYVYIYIYVLTLISFSVKRTSLHVCLFVCILKSWFYIVA